MLLHSVLGCPDWLGCTSVVSLQPPADGPDMQPPSCSPMDCISLHGLHEVRCAAFVRGEDEGANHNDASWLLDFYQTFADDIDADCTDHALSALSQIEGRFGAAECVVLRVQGSRALKFRVFVLSVR